MQIVFSVYVLVKVQLYNLKVAMLVIAGVLVCLIVVPEYHEQRLRFDVFVEGWLHVPVDLELRGVGHVVKHHLTKNVARRVFISFIKNSILNVTLAIFFYVATNFIELFGTLRKIWVKFILWLIFWNIIKNFEIRTFF